MNSSSKLLILIDEIGKATNYKDGMALLAVMIEHFIDKKSAYPITFIATYYFEVYSFLRSKEMTSLLTIASERDQSGIPRSTYQVMHGAMSQTNFTEFPESTRIINNIFRRSSRSEELENFNSAYHSELRVFIIILIKVYLKKGTVSLSLI
jgi:DNA mismatch repair ATPase MutS